MGGTKIFVLQMNDIIRWGLFALAGIVLLVALLFFLLPRGRGEAETNEELPRPTTQARYIPGVYAATIILNNEPVQVRVTVSENEILSIYMTDLAEISQIFFPLFEPRMRDLAEEILRYQSAYIDPTTDYPVTTSILQQAVIAALQLAYPQGD
ncbi:MAG: hypothetical protein FWC16_10775 [Defluviitaleaceae bacterium]|nr:hypothetical protein [Defluviitaleaceae bacterium]MCL2189769.1 hypothetical protein [Defluviitaleaceae bacterium]MCL2275401.1 hypothetical protein [Defluviitaleaceae bacterium]